MNTVVEEDMVVIALEAMMDENALLSTWCMRGVASAGKLLSRWYDGEHMDGLVNGFVDGLADGLAIDLVDGVTSDGVVVEVVVSVVAVVPVDLSFDDLPMSVNWLIMCSGVDDIDSADVVDVADLVNDVN